MRVRTMTVATIGTACLLVGGGMATASAATKYTATACPSSRTTMMCLEDTNTGQTAFDDQGKDNKTLDNWYYPGGQTEIANHLNKVIVYSGCKVQFYSGQNFSGALVATVYGTNSGASKSLSGTIKSFHWVC